MNDEAILAMLKIDLGISGDGYNERLLQYIASAKKQMEREGITIADSPSADDAMLIVMYSAWMWRKRVDGDGMPRMLRYLLNNRLFHEKMDDTTADGAEG